MLAKSGFVVGASSGELRRADGLNSLRRQCAATRPVDRSVSSLAYSRFRSAGNMGPRNLVRFAGAERTRKQKFQHRKVRRRPQESFAWVMLDGEPVKCGLLDLTSVGARLVSRYAPLFRPSFIL